MKKPTNPKWKIAASLALAASLAWADTAAAAVLLTDNFTVTSNSQNVNQELAGRQAGPLALATYTGLNEHHQVGNTGTDVGQPGGVSNSGYVLLALNGNFQSDLNIAAVSTGTLTIEVDMYNNGTNPGGGGTGQWVAFALRREGQTFPVAGAGEFGFLKRANGGVQVFQNGGSIAPGSWDTAGFATADHWTLIFTDTAGTGSAFVGNGSKVTMINGSTTLGTLTLNQLNRSGLKLGFTQDNNRFAGIDNLTISGTLPALAVTTTNQSGGNPFTPSWTAETPSLIAGMSPTTANGDFAKEFSGGTPILTDGTIGTSGTIGGFATAGGGGGSGSTLIYTLTNSINGSDVTNIVVYSGWGDGGRHGQYYDLSYSTVAAPSTYIPITTVFYLPGSYSGAPANRVSIAMVNGSPLGTAVANIKFDFSSPPNSGSFNNGYQGYSEIIVQGSDTTAPPPPPSPYLTQDTLPASAATVVGDQVVFTAAYSNAPPATLQWQVISGGVTNDISGATSATLTLNNVQVADSGAYRLKAVNATNGAAAPSYSSARPLTVNSVPAPVNNVITAYAAQTGMGNASANTNFYPTWTVAGNSLITGAIPTPGPGDYGRDQTAGDPAILTDGTFGYLNYWPGVGGSPSLVTCGVNPGGQAVTYTFDTSITGSTNGYDLTNIVVYGGWGDGGRDQQKYQILYSTVADPATFNQLVTVDYNPANPNNTQSASRATVRPASGSLVQNVAAVMFNFNLVGAPPENGYEGYSEIVVAGVASAPKPVLSQDIRPLTAADVVGSQIVISAAFTSATPVTYQWKKDGVNVPGANTPTLTLNNLQLTDTATNGGYSLYASNASGFAFSRGCAVTVNSAPTPATNLITAYAYQTGDSSVFSPTWSVVSGSLIANQSPSSTGTGNFNDPDVNPTSNGLAGGIPVLTDENYGSVINGGPHPAFATCGPNAGRFVVYTLTGSANGYNLTNIVIAGGWNDSGRDQQAYTVGYSTVANPSSFIPLAVVNTNPVLAVNANKTVIRTTLTPASGALATNVAAVMINFITPAGENGYSGYSEISLYGSPTATSDSGPLVTAENQLGVTSWTVETPNLIANQLPSSQGAGVFTLEGCNVTNLTDGAIGNGFAFGASCGAEGGSVPYVIFNAVDGWNLTNIVVYSLWHDYGRDGQFYNVSYSTTANPATFLPLASVFYNPDVPQDGTDSGNRVNIAPPVGQTLLASNVAAVKFDFTLQGSHDFGWSGYSEIVLQGTNLPPRVRFDASYVSGGNLILTGVGAPGQSYAVLTSTNVAAPIATWTTNMIGVVSGSGVISNAIPFSTSEPARFFRLKTP